MIGLWSKTPFLLSLMHMDAGLPVAKRGYRIRSMIAFDRWSNGHQNNSLTDSDAILPTDPRENRQSNIN